MATLPEPMPQVFYLSMLANLASPHLFSSTIEAELFLRIKWALLLPYYMELLADEWEIAWGPAVFKTWLSLAPDNVVYAARSQATDSGPARIVVAIAGTNVLSTFDWLIEDLGVSRQVEWPTGSPPADARISQGTHAGLSILQEARPRSRVVPGRRTRLHDFLATQTAEPVEVWVAGHSLGGALSPALALWLSDTQDTWDPGRKATIHCLPSAGPTPGNGAFADYYAGRLGDTTTRICNTIDIVPHAWATSDLQEIPHLYAPAIEPDALIEGLVELAVLASQHGDYCHLGETQGFAGAVNTRIVDPDETALGNFAAQIAYQHTIPYLIEILGSRPPGDAYEPVWRALAPRTGRLKARTIRDRLGKKGKRVQRRP